MLKDGNIYEFYGNGMEEIVPEERVIHIIPMVSRKRKLHRKVDSFTFQQAVAMGIVIGMPAGLMVYEMVLGEGVMRIWSAMALVVDAFWIWQNYWRKR